MTLRTVTCIVAFTLAGCSGSRPPAEAQNGSLGVVESVRDITASISTPAHGAHDDIREQFVGGERRDVDSSETESAADQPSTAAAPLQQITVKLQDGDRVTVTQHEVFDTGDRVRVVSVGGETAVIQDGPSEMRPRARVDVREPVKYVEARELASRWATVRDFGSAAPSLAPRPPATVQYYAWNQYQGFPTVMMPVNEGICFLQGVTGKFRGGGESVWVRSNGSRWELNGTSFQQDVSARAMCVPTSIIQGADQGVSYSTGTSSQWVQNRSECSWWEGCNQTASQFRLLGGREQFCYLTGMAGLFDGGGEAVGASTSDPSGWYLGGVTSAWSGYIRGEAGCLSVVGHPMLKTTNVVFSYQWSQGEPFRQLPNSDEAFCVLNWMQGRFAGWGETLEIYHNPDSTQWLGGSSQQEGLKSRASCFYYNQRL